MFDLLFDPFSMGFMRRALAGCIALSLAGPPLGVFLVLRRMSLTTDVLQHGILPGIALGAVFGGMSLLAMGAGESAAWEECSAKGWPAGRPLLPTAR